MGKGNCRVFVGLVLILTARFCTGLTDPRDVMAINSLYIALGFPPLDKWLPIGGDPCGDKWHGVDCVFWNITSIRLRGMDLGGVLSEDLGDFESIITIDLRDNHIGGSIPLNLPLTIRNFSLSGNRFNGSIPNSLSALTQLSDLSLGNNLLSGGIPDAFEQLTGLTTLHLSGNNLTGQLPPSMGNLSAIKILHLQNNKLTGTLDVLQDLTGHLTELDIENNLFSGPIPPRLLGIPNFRKDGNPFNTTIIPSPPAALPPSPAAAPYSDEAPWKQADGPSGFHPTKPTRPSNFWTTKSVILIVALGVFVLVILGVCLSMWRCCKNKKLNKTPQRHDMDVFKGPIAKPDYSKSSSRPNLQMGNASKEETGESVYRYRVDNRKTEVSAKPSDEKVIDVMKLTASSRYKKDHMIEMLGVGAHSTLLQPPPPLPGTLPVEKVIVNPIVPAKATLKTHRSAKLTSSSASVFTIASLQQYTDSFSEENFIGEGQLGSVYRAEVPDGKLFAVKKLKTSAAMHLSDEEFLDLVIGVSKLRHPNLVELVGYCNEYGQRLLVYEYCRHGTLYDALQMDDEVHNKLSWNARVRMALGAARALQYLHEVCDPPVVHGNFKSANILLDDRLAVHVSDCGLAPLVSSCGSANQLSGCFLTAHVDGAPELELGTYTCQSDVYSLGVVMLELLTGRKSHDRSRPRGEQSLVRWAVPQLHDIDALSRMVDPSLHGAYPVKSLSRFADIISRCVQLEPGFRPPVLEVVQDLLHMI